MPLLSARAARTSSISSAPSDRVPTAALPRLVAIEMRINSGARRELQMLSWLSATASSWPRVSRRCPPHARDDGRPCWCCLQALRWRNGQ